MLTSLDCAGSVNVSEHSVPDMSRRISAEFTETVRDNQHRERILRLLPVVLLTIRGKDTMLHVRESESDSST